MTDEGDGSCHEIGAGHQEHPLLEVEELENHYPVTGGLFDRRVGTVRAVDGVSFSIDAGETLGLVGESGCGKSTLAASLLRLEEPTAGSVRFDGEEVTTFDDRRLKRFRREARLLVQDPDSSFDPRMRVGESVTEPLRIHGVDDPRRRRELGEAIVRRVGLDPEDYDRYPHEFSGGQRQRLALARALVTNPRLLVADEPVSALDVSVQSEVLSLLVELQRDFGLAVLLVTHDLSLVRNVCDRVAVMYLGRLVEVGPTERVYAEPKHPYTEALLSAIPEPTPGEPPAPTRLSGDVPDAANPPSGCRFHTRCPAIVKPDTVGVEQAAWRRLVDARGRVVEGAVDVDAIRERAAVEAGEPPRAIAPHRLEAAIREELDLDERFPDPEIERAVEAGVAALAAGEDDRAARRFDEVIETPCIGREPRLRAVDPGHDVACHLHHPEDRETEAADSTAFEWIGDRSP